ncbi:MFS transporter [Brucepastera parasyntrophica]|uniref:MFS transporter n=1 Tax=Brucepastera parasyntrophica TaxID=2880008 RepID=UPI0021098B0C|nr:MFS transporter [Brucepastera parasyntrophica]ULQ59726.1 MFS transporter [Brucepastera parasyntrophica]
MNNSKTFWSGFAGFGLILLIAFTLNGVLDISGFESTYRDSLVSQFSIQGEAVKSRIESALNLGKKLYLLDNQIDEIFYDSIKQGSGIQHFYVADRDDVILYSTRTVMNQNHIPFQFLRGSDLAAGEDRPPSETVKFLDSYYICIPLYSEGRTFEGTLLVEFSEKTISGYIYKTAETLVKTGLIFLVVTLGLYYLLLQLLPQHRRVETIVTVILLLGSQLVFTVQNYNLYNTSITGMFNKNMSVLAKSIAEDFQKPLDYNIKLEDLGRADSYLAKRMDGNPQCADMYITDINLNILYETHRENIHKSGEGSDARLTRQDPDLTIIPLTSVFGNGYLVLRVNRPMINNILRDMALDSGTIIVVALIFAFLLKDFFAFLSGRRHVKQINTVRNEEDEKNSLRLIKISTFIFMFAAFETLSFIPIFIQHIYLQNPYSLGFFTEQTIISLPVSSYMLGIMVAMFITLFGMKNLSIRNRYIIMTLVFIAGSVLTIFSENIPVLIAARFVAGFGFGGVLLSTSSLVISYTNEKTRSRGFGTNAAAFAAASICSIPVGGIIVNKFGYAAGIWVSIVFAVLFLLFVFFCIKKDSEPDEQKEAQAVVPVNENRLTARSFLRILTSRHVIVYILCINIPFQLIYVGLFQFLLPLYMSDTLGMTQGNIGRFLSIFSIVSLGAVFVSTLSDYVKNDKLLLSFGSLCVGIVLILFGMYPAGGIFLFVCVLIAMGVDNVFIDAVEEVYVSSGNIKGISEENLLQSYKTIEKIISVFIPTVTGLIIMSAGFSASMLFIGVWSAVGAIAFLLLGKNGRWGGIRHEA